MFTFKISFNLISLSFRLYSKRCLKCQTEKKQRKYTKKTNNFIPIITVRIRRMRESNIFSLFTLVGGGGTRPRSGWGREYPIPGPDRRVPHPRSGWRVPNPRSGWGVPHPADRGIPHPRSGWVPHVMRQ